MSVIKILNNIFLVMFLTAPFIEYALVTYKFKYTIVNVLTWISTICKSFFSAIGSCFAIVSNYCIFYLEEPKIINFVKNLCSHMIDFVFGLYSTTVNNLYTPFTEIIISPLNIFVGYLQTFSEYHYSPLTVLSSITIIVGMIVVGDIVIRRYLNNNKIYPNNNKTVQTTDKGTDKETKKMKRVFIYKKTEKNN